MTLSAPTTAPSSIAERLDEVLRRIEAAAAAAGRAPGSVALTAVSKTQPEAAVDAALAWGQRRFGENRVQEAKARWDGARGATPGLELRLIGPLQTNKAVEAVDLFDVIETVDRPGLVEALGKAVQKTGRSPRLLVQVNTGEEPQKAGVAPREADALIAACRKLGLSIEGLMAIPPVEEAAGPHFALLARIAARNGLETLSMGMSEDFALAVRFGATHVRLGTAIFGARDEAVTTT